VKRELGRTTEQIERLRSRLDETAGESRSRFDAITSSVNQARLLAGLGMIFALAAAVLVVVLR
jgi:hypothetical protein